MQCSKSNYRTARMLVFGTAVVLLVVCGFTAVTLRASTARFGHVCDLGRQLIYRIGYAGNDASAPGAVFGGEQSAKSTQEHRLRFSGVLTVTTSACDATGSTSIWNVVQPSIDLTGSGSAMFGATLQNDLSHPYVIREDLLGRILTIAHDPSSGELGTSVMRRIASEMQIVTPSQRNLIAQTWHVDEPDIAGSRSSTYQIDPWIVDPLGTAMLAFHRTSGVEVDPPSDGRTIRHATIHGVADDRGRYRSDGSLDWLSTTYTEKTTITGNVIGLSQVAFEAQWIAAPRVPQARIAAIRAYGRKLLDSDNAVALHLTPSEETVARHGYVSSLGKETAATLSLALAALPVASTAQQRSPIAEKLTALFYLHPETIAAFAARARTADYDSNAFRIIVQAAEDADTPKTQHALLDLLRARADDANAGPTLAAGIGLLEKPIAAVDAALEDAMATAPPPTAQAAELGLGTIAWTTSLFDAKRSSALVTRLRETLHRSHSDRDLVRHLLALGNTRSPIVLAEFAPYVRSHDAPVRAATAIALRHQESSDADAYLIALLADSEDVVRLGATSAFAARNPSDAAFDALANAARTDSNATVRSDAVTAIWKARARHPNVDAIVAEIAERDTDQNVRKMAQSALDSQQDVDPELQAPIDRLPH